MKDGEYTVKPQANVMNILTIPLTDKEILEKVLQKAIDGGYDHIPYSVTEHADFLIESKALPLIIYRHDFAKALWGDEKIVMTEYRNEVMPVDPLRTTMDTQDTMPRTYRYYNWQYHLQRMVISDNPIQYLKDNI